MTGEALALLREVDEQLELLIKPLRNAVDSCGCVILVQGWERMRYFALLPFHLHLRWPGRIEMLPLNLRIGILPLFESDLFTASTPMYKVSEVIAQRMNARVSRASVESFPEDFVPQDWEGKAAKHLSRLGELILPGVSYVAVDRITPEGSLIRGHRSALGRISDRSGLRLHILAPTRRGVSVKSACAFDQMDILLVNAQGLRGFRTIASLRRVIDRCAGRTPMLILASSPTDVLTLFREGLPEWVRLQFLGDVQRSFRATISVVGHDRPSADREFEFATEGLEQNGPKFADLVRMAKAAWWALRQALYQASTEQIEVRRFFAALDRVLTQMPVEASLLTAVRQLILREMANRELKAERVRALIDATLAIPGDSGTLVLVRDEDEARQFKANLAEELRLSPKDIEKLGVYVTGRRGFWPDRPFDAVITAGYFGMRTIDVLLGCRPSHMCLVLDPIEARAAWYQTQRTANLLKSCNAFGFEGAMRNMAEEISRYVAAFGDVVEISLAPSKFEKTSDTDDGLGSRCPSPQHALVVFTDGSVIEVSLHARFEVVREAGRRLKILEACALEPGDQVVVLNEDSRALFSEQMLDALDQGPLERQAEKRATWLAVVQSVYAARQTSAQSIVRAMEERGHPTDVATIRSWLRFDRTDIAIPDRPERFMAFATILGIGIEPHELLNLYSGIQNWRVNHRKFGRELARAVRSAYLGRLDAATLRKIEQNWGISARQLVECARVAVVDEVILPESVEDVAH